MTHFSSSILPLLFVLQVSLVTADNCTSTSCDSCVESSGCNWCAISSSCVASDSHDCQNYTQGSCDSPDYAVIVFVVILATLVCLCFSTCYWRKFRQNPNDGIMAPLLNLPSSTRNYLFRNSLLDMGNLCLMY